MAPTSESRIIDRTPPGPKGRFLVGNLLEFRSNPLRFLERCRRDFGDIVRVTLGSRRSYLLFHPKDIEFALQSHHNSFVKGKTGPLKTLLGESLLTTEGQVWRGQHDLLQPEFQQRQVFKYARTVLTETEGMLSSLRPCQAYNLHQVMVALTSAIMGQILFGTDWAEIAGHASDATELSLRLFSSPLRWYRALHGLLTLTSIRFWSKKRQLNAALARLIQKRRIHREDDLLSKLLLLGAGRDSPVTDGELRDHLVTLFVAGHETTALALTYTVYLLAKHADVEEKLVAELDARLGDEPLDASKLEHFAYLQSVIREALRLYPPTYALARIAREDLDLHGYHIPKESRLSIYQFLVHRDARWYAEPERFNPDRWTNERLNELPRCAFFPFGAGPRICIGEKLAMMEMGLVLASIYRGFRIRLVRPAQPLELVLSVTLRPKYPIRVEISER